MIAGQPLLVHTCRAFQAHPKIEGIIVVARKNQMRTVVQVLKRAKISKILKIVSGGARRQDSTAAGLSAAASFIKDAGVCILHNGANPFVTPEEITGVIHQTITHGAAGVGRPLSSTLKKVTNGKVVSTIPRSGLFVTETPQGIRSDFLQKCIRKAHSSQEYTDDLMLAEACGIHPVIVPASDHNRKITTDADIENATTRFFFVPPACRVGIGMDSHRFLKGKNGGVLGGVFVKNMPAISAESDGDVVLHALATALSQAMGGGSLGTFAKPLRTKKCDSAVYLKKINLKKYRISNVGIMIECALPHIDPLAPQMKQRIASLLKISVDRIGITATSGEKLTPWGKGEGIACTAIVSLRADL